MGEFQDIYTIKAKCATWIILYEVASLHRQTFFYLLLNKKSFKLVFVYNITFLCHQVCNQPPGQGPDI
jgi:hypothetical protein